MEVIPNRMQTKNNNQKFAGVVLDSPWQELYLLNNVQRIVMLESACFPEFIVTVWGRKLPILIFSLILVLNVSFILKGFKKRCEWNSSSNA